MSGSLISLASDYENDASPVVRMRVSFGSNPPPFVYDRLHPEIISITDVSDS